MVRIMLGLDYRSSCRIWFRKYDILTVPCLYILSLAMFVINNPYLETNLSVHGTDTRQKNQLPKPPIKFSSIQKSVVCYAIKVFNKLPLFIKQLQQNKVQFKNALKKFLVMHTFYRVEEFLLH
jgi:hypothetical protein